jgi:glycine/D-amino acid oxidase-like deaminating enzyme
MASMIRDLDRLTAQTFDLLVVGGGIYGLTIAYDAAQRGLSVALVERNDFGSGRRSITFRTFMAVSGICNRSTSAGRGSRYAAPHHRARGATCGAPCPSPCRSIDR